MDARQKVRLGSDEKPIIKSDQFSTRKVNVVIQKKDVDLVKSQDLQLGVRFYFQN